MTSPRRAMVLAAGFGTRLRPLTETMPKALVPVAGRPMIDWALAALARAGVETVVVNLHHLGDQIREHLGERRLGLEIVYSLEPEILDTGGGIRRARPFLDGEPFFVANCDALHDADLSALAARHGEAGTVATLLVREDPAARRYGLLEVEGEGAGRRIRRFLGQGPDGVYAPRMFCGIHVLSPAIFEHMDHMPEKAVFSITRDVYAPLALTGSALGALDHYGYWRDLGSPESLAAAAEDIRAGRLAQWPTDC